MSNTIKWDHKDEWRNHGRDFLVTVTRHSVSPSSISPHDGVNRWAVYAYIYPQHRLFGLFGGEAMWQPAATSLPLHGGPSMLRWHLAADCRPCSVQVGADYNHLHDDFTHFADQSQASEVFADAERLFNHLAASVEADVCLSN